MATPAQIILIIACACLVDCRYMRERSHKQQSSASNHQVIQTQTIRDSDAVIFPSDDNNIDDVGKKVDATNNQHNDKGVIKAKTDPKINAPLTSKVVPAIEIKDVLTNPIDKNKVNADKVINEKGKTLNVKADEVKTVAVTDNNGTVIGRGDPLESNKTAPDLSARFGGNSYVLVPANNQNYQPVQTLPYNTQGVAAPNTQFANIAPNIGPNHPNVGQYPPNVFNPTSQANTNNFVPVNVPNTYMINGQLYAAVTVPNNVEVISPIYLVNPQSSGYQVQNAPLYNLVTVSGLPQANMNGNSQFVSS